MMKLLSLLSLFLGFAAAVPLEAVAPDVSDVRILSITAAGTGCPGGHAFGQIDATGTIFDVSFDDYVVEAGPGTSAADTRKNCRVSLNIEFPQGYQFSILDTTFRGYAGLASDQTGTCKATYSFAGSQSSTSAELRLRGPFSDNYELNKDVGIVSWSTCGDHTAILSVNSEIRISPVTTANKGVMTVDEFDGRLHVIFETSWRHC